jgi:hypothetical protein
MAQAKTLTKEEMTRALDYINTRRFAQRNRAMMLLTHLAGLRIGEVACLRWSDVMNLDGSVKDARHPGGQAAGQMRADALHLTNVLAHIGHQPKLVGQKGQHSITLGGG